MSTRYTEIKFIKYIITTYTVNKEYIIIMIYVKIE